MECGREVWGIMRYCLTFRLAMVRGQNLASCPLEAVSRVLLALQKSINALTSHHLCRMLSIAHHISRCPPIIGSPVL